MRWSWLPVAIVLAGCGGQQRSPASPQPTASPSAGTPRHRDPGILRGIHFATTPVVRLGSCRVKDKRKCAKATYEVYARLDHVISRRRPRVDWAAFAIAGSRWVDPIKHPRRHQTCFIEALYSEDPRADHLPTRPGARMLLRFQVFHSARPVPVGEISTVVRLSRPDEEHAPGASRTAMHDVGC
jgi:hypothetical protein